jgi:hypothetical protein
MSMLNVGDKIRILEDGHNCAAVEYGDVLVVLNVYPDCFKTERWWFELEDEGTGWERYEGDE